jgi:hypothetical protein
MRISEIAFPINQRVHPGNVWRVLGSDGKRTDLVMRSLICEQVLQGILADFLSFNDEGVVQPEGVARTSFVLGDIRLNLGSIHSVKGRTVDSVLIVETEVFKGSAANQKAMDLAAVLPQAFGIGNIDFDANEAHLSAAMNVFVGATRARSLLALGVRKEAVTADLIERAREQGWNVRDLTGA